MECLLPNDAFHNNTTDENDNHLKHDHVDNHVIDYHDSNRCVDGYESSTPISNSNNNKSNTNIMNISTNIDIITNTNTDKVYYTNEDDHHDMTNTNIYDNIKLCKSPTMSSVDRLKRLEMDLNSFALDDSISNIIINDGDIDFIDNNITDNKLNNKSDDNIDYDNNDIDMSCKSPILFTPIKKSNFRNTNSYNRNINSHSNNNKSNIDMLNNIYTRFDEPHVNISDDETKNPILANSIRRNYNNLNNADIIRSERILGNSRCWTDRFDNIDNNNITNVDSESATQSPIRSLTSILSSSQADIELLSTKRNYDYYNNNTYNSDQNDLSYNHTPTRSYTRSIDKYTDYLNKPKSENINTDIKSYNKSDSHITLDMFNNYNIMDMLNKDYNPMYNVVLTKDEMCKCKLTNDLEMLYKHFKNLCTILKRGSMRNDQPYFRIIQMLVQRMSRKSFSIDNLKQILWLAPNLVNVRWVLINDVVRKKYSAEYKDSTDKIYDLSIKLYKSNNNIDMKVDNITNITPSRFSDNSNNMEYCYTTQDYENVCYRFKNILCCWSLKCEYDNCYGIDIPYYSIPENKLRSNLSTPRRDSISMVVDEVTPIRSIVRTGMYNYLNTTPIKSYNNFKQRDLSYNYTPTRSYTKSITNTYDNYKSSQSNNTTNNYDYDIILSSNKRIKINDVSMSPMSQELLNTPGMKRIRENAKKLSIQNKMNIDNSNDLKYWIDMRWFTKILLELMTRDTNSYKLDFVVDFISKYGSRKVTQDQVTKWIDSLCDIDPNILQKSISKFEDYSTIITFNKSSTLNHAIDHINQQIKTLQSV